MQTLIAITGEAGVGKSTLVKHIKRHAPQTPTASTGQLIRETYDKDNPPLWLQMGELAPEADIRAMVENWIKENQTATSLVLDGMPRIPDQVTWLDTMADKYGLDLRVLMLEASEELKSQRIKERNRAGDEFHDARSAKDANRMRKTKARIIEKWMDIDMQVIEINEDTDMDKLAVHVIFMHGLI